MPKSEMLNTLEETVRLDQHLLTRWKARVAALRAARSKNRMESFRGQMILARDFKMVMPLLAARLPRSLRDVLSDVRPIPPARPKRCLQCDGHRDPSRRCVSRECPYEKVDGRYQETRCQAV